MDFQIEWITSLAINIIIAIIAISISIYFGFFYKSRIEILFLRHEENNLELLFREINILDDNFMTFCNLIEKKICPIPKEDKELLKITLPLKPIFENGKKVGDEIESPEKHPGINNNFQRFNSEKQLFGILLEKAQTQHKNIFEEFLSKKNSYIDPVLKRDVSCYCFYSIDFLKYIPKNYSYASFLEKRRIYAKQIINYFAKNDVKISNGHITKFIDKWNEYYELKKDKPS